jgi:hypothetical protein
MPPHPDDDDEEELDPLGLRVNIVSLENVWQL